MIIYTMSYVVNQNNIFFWTDTAFQRHYKPYMFWHLFSGTWSKSYYIFSNRQIIFCELLPFQISVKNCLNVEGINFLFFQEMHHSDKVDVYQLLLPYYYHLLSVQ